MRTLKPLEVITARILVMRDKRVLIDADLAALYGVTNEAPQRTGQTHHDTHSRRLHVQTDGKG